MKPLLVVCSLLALTGCARFSAHAKRVDALKTAQSWAATAVMVAEAWQHGEVPDAYAQQTLVKSQQAVATAAHDVTGAPAISQELQHVQQTLSQLAVVVQQSRTRDLAASLQALATDQQQLKALARAEGD